MLNAWFSTLFSVHLETDYLTKTEFFLLKVLYINIKIS